MVTLSAALWHTVHHQGVYFRKMQTGQSGATVGGAQSQVRRSLADTRAATGLVVYCNPFPWPPKRMNICDAAPVNLQYIDMLAVRHWVGDLPLRLVPQLLNPYEASCVDRYFRHICLQDSVSVFLAPTALQMGPYANWYGAKPLGPGSVGRHCHEEVWIAFLFAAASGSRYWLWMAKKESELLGELGMPDLRTFMAQYGR